jgi:hypothetical protein
VIECSWCGLAHEGGPEHCDVAAQRDAIRALLTRADSYLSLLWHRYVPADLKTDLSLRLEVERTIGDLRKAGR